MKLLLLVCGLVLTAAWVKAAAGRPDRPVPRRERTSEVASRPVERALAAEDDVASAPVAPVVGAAQPLDGAPQTAPEDPRVLLSMPQDAETVEVLARAYPRLREEGDPLAGQVEGALVRALTDPSENIRAAAVGGLGAAAGEHAARLQAVYDLDPSPSVRSEVVHALSGSREFLRRVQATDRDTDVRRFASEVARMVHSE